MSDDKIFIGRRIDKIIEIQRLEREGATLKNVSDNMRSLSACIGIFIAIGLIYKTAPVTIQVVAGLWGIWALVYTLMACIQSGYLFIAAVVDFLFASYKSKITGKLRSVLVYIFSVMSLLFTLGAALIVLVAIKHVTAK